MFSKSLYLPRVWAGTQLSSRFLPSTIRPLSAHVKLTENCQAKCISCDYWKSRWHDAIDTETAVDLLNQIGSLGISTLRLTGGEPLLRKDLFEILEKAVTARFKQIIIQTNGLALKKLHKQVNASPITNVAVSIDGLRDTNDNIRGIRGYFDLALEGIRLLQGKHISLSITLNRLSAHEMEELGRIASGLGAQLEFNILSRSLYFLQNADLASMWPERGQVPYIASFVNRHRPAYEADYISRYYSQESISEPPCVLGYLQVFVLSNGDVLTGCYPLKPVGNVLQQSLESILASDGYIEQCRAMLRRECPGCTCGVESSLAMQHAGASAFFEIGRLIKGSPKPMHVRDHEGHR